MTIQFLSTDSDAVIERLKSDFEISSGSTLQPSDPRLLMLKTVAAEITRLRVDANQTGLLNLLDYAYGVFLDAKGAGLADRLPAQPSQVTLEFTLSIAQPGVYAITKGTLVTNGEFQFKTKEILQIPAGSLSGSVSAECTIAGNDSNGIQPGEIRQIVTALPFVTAVSNTTTSTGGAEIESDPSYRERIRLAPSEFSTAGPEQAYIALAKSVSSLIVDVKAISPSPGVVEVYVLLADGELPDQDLLDLILAKINGEFEVPLTDSVSVFAATAFNYTVDIEYFISNNDLSEIQSIQSAVSQAVADYNTWQSSIIGRDIEPQEMIKRVLNAGAKRCVVSNPSRQILSAPQVAIVSAVNVVYGGSEDE